MTLVPFSVVKLLVSLSDRKRKRVFQLLELYEKSEDEQEKEEILAVIQEVLQRPWTAMQAIPAEELEVPEEGKRELNKYFRWLGKQIRKHRKKAGLTQAELASRTGMPLYVISRLERAVYAPTYTPLRKIALALGISPEELDPAWEHDG